MSRTMFISLPWEHKAKKQNVLRKIGDGGAQRTSGHKEAGLPGGLLGADGREGRLGRPQPWAFLSLQLAKTPLPRTQNPQGVETSDWR